MTGIGQLVECIEDMEIANLDMEFHKGIYYTALIGEEIYIIDREHRSLQITNTIFKKHFKIK